MEPLWHTTSTWYEDDWGTPGKRDMEKEMKAAAGFKYNWKMMMMMVAAWDSVRSRKVICSPCASGTVHSPFSQISSYCRSRHCDHIIPTSNWTDTLWYNTLQFKVSFDFLLLSLSVNVIRRWCQRSVVVTVLVWSWLDLAFAAECNVNGQLSSSISQTWLCAVLGFDFCSCNTHTVKYHITATMWHYY